VRSVGDAVRLFMRDNNMNSVESLAMNTTLTIEEARQAKAGKLVSSKMETQLGDSVADIYRQERRAEFEALATHLRSSANAAERKQLSALLNIQPSTDTGCNGAAKEPLTHSPISDLRADIKKMTESL